MACPLLVLGGRGGGGGEKVFFEKCGVLGVC